MTTIAFELALANRILSNEGVMDTFGHASCRRPDDPDRFLLSVAIPPLLAQETDIIEYTLDAAPVEKQERPLFSEAVIHSEIYRARPDVQAICHHHAPAIMPFCVSGTALRPISQLGAAIGREAPFWDSRDEFGDTNLLLTKQEHGQSLARALGSNWIVLMRRHGATVVGRSLKEMVFRSMHSTLNATAQMHAILLGNVDHLSEGEIELAGDIKSPAIYRTWLYASERLARVER